MNRTQLALILLGVLALCVLTRLPMIYHPDMVLTGDECVVGLMAKDLVEGQKFSLYFYGQHYGLSIVESAAGAITFALVGISAIALKLAMLLLLLAAVAVLCRAFYLIGGILPAIAGPLLFLTMPPWTEWSIQARGGYISAVLATAGVIYCATGKGSRSTPLRWLAISFLAAVTILAKGSWLPALLPILLLEPVRRRSCKLAVGVMATTALIAIAIHLLGTTFTLPYWEQPSLSLMELPTQLARFPSLLTYHFVTNLFTPTANNPLYTACGLLWLAWLPLGLVVQARRLRQRDFNPWSHVFCLSVLASLAALTLIPLQPRYLLSVSFFMALWLAAEIAPRRSMLNLYVALLIISGLGGIAVESTRLLRNDPASLSAQDQLHEFIDLLESEDIHHVYSLEPLLQWQVMFYSKESITARWFHPDDRLPELPRRVDQAQRDGLPTAIIGVRQRMGGLASLEGITIYGQEGTPFFVAPYPTSQHLTTMSFHLTE